MLWYTCVCVRADTYPDLVLARPITLPSYLGIVVTYSDEDIGLEIQSLLVQFYPILLSTLLSIKRQQLSLLDVYFALLVSVSPLAVYLSFASFCNLFGTRTGLFNRIESNGFVISAFGAFVPFLWIALSMVTGFSSSAFEDSACYPTQTFLEWLKATVLYLISGFLSYGGASLSALALFLPFLILLFRRRSQVWADVKLSEAPKWRVPFTWVKYAWYVPIPIDPRPAKPNARKVHYQPSTQVVYSSSVRVHRCHMVTLGYF